ncbi:MAG: DUF3316 domain-containing protein [Muribaculaceae bacterium]|nr:DUF3316 domain-containing protein [Muribaculaceae bacterium]MBQ4008806.1 DUF3316 domain-containing protein [Muribaculaceae bacterium]MBQ5465998.1 DUF3316 domain-containing protein [Muribaculaceae bacterium]
MKILTAWLLCACTGHFAAMAQDSVEVVRPVHYTMMGEVGHASLLDSYLTPITYTGLNLGLGFEHFQATGFNPDKWVRELELGADYSYVENPVGNHEMHSLMGEARWSLMRRWRDVPARRLQLMAGPMVNFRGGILYNANNSNNVVSARIHFAVGVQAAAVYNTRLFSHPLALRYQLSLPVLGAFFSPEYDEAYYEIFVGNRRHLAHLGWWGSRFDMNNLVTADWRLGGTILRVGYRCRIEKSWVSHIDTRAVTHAVVIGLGGEILNLSPSRKLSDKAQVMSAMFE